MATIALVQSHPYDADLGGDAAYIQAFAQYLAQAGHEVCGLVSDITRGRTSPVYHSAYAIEQFRSWQVRGAARLGTKTFVGLPTGVLRKFSMLPGAKRSKPAIDRWAPREAAWVNDNLSTLRPNATVLVHEAVHFSPFLADAGAIFALVGHIPTRRNLLDANHCNGEAKEGHKNGSMLSNDEKMLAASLASTDGIGFNSRDDIAYAGEHFVDKAALFVGMGYPDAAPYPDSDEPIVLFVGNATSANRLALSWFLNSVWPTVVAAHPAARFRVVGRVASIDDSQVGKSVECVGPVRDLASEYRRAQVVVAPLVSGTAGVKIKVAEAMSHSRPLVTTSIGVDSRDMHQLDDGAIVADEPADFARGVIAILTDGELRKMKSVGAIMTFKKHFSYSACYGEFSTWLERMVHTH